MSGHDSLSRGGCRKEAAAAEDAGVACREATPAPTPALVDPAAGGERRTVVLAVAGWQTVVAVLDRSARANAAGGFGGRYADLADDVAGQAGLARRPWRYAGEVGQ